MGGDQAPPSHSGAHRESPAQPRTPAWSPPQSMPGDPQTHTQMHMYTCTQEHMCIHRHMCTRMHVYTDSHGYTQLRADLPRVHMHAHTPAHTDTVAHTPSVGTPTQHHDPPRPLTRERASQMHPERTQDKAGHTSRVRRAGQGGAALRSYSCQDPHGPSRSESLEYKPEQAQQPGQL